MPPSTSPPPSPPSFPPAPFPETERSSDGHPRNFSGFSTRTSRQAQLRNIAPFTNVIHSRVPNAFVAAIRSRSVSPDYLSKLSISASFLFSPLQNIRPRIIRLPISLVRLRLVGAKRREEQKGREREIKKELIGRARALFWVTREVLKETRYSRKTWRSTAIGLSTRRKDHRLVNDTATK